MSDVDAELKKITDLAAPEPLQRLPKYCDHTSVGVLIFNKAGELLLIDRGTFPFGMAPPAGHVDEHGSYEQAAIDEVREEVGLEVLDLELVAEGRVENPCRRVNGTWHYWKVYRATADGELNLSPRETRGAEWCDVPRLRELGALGVSEESEHLESVWKYWLNKVYATQGESNGHSR